MPEAAGLRRKLGWALLETDAASEAYYHLDIAVAADPSNRQGLYLLGRAAEAKGDTLRAIAAYRTYLEGSRGRVRKEDAAVRARLSVLTLGGLHSAARDAIRRETTLDVASIPADTWAVPDFATSTGGDTLRALSKGLAVVLTTDLASIPGLRVVERRRASVLLEELALARPGVGPVPGPALSIPVANTTAPRWGRLLGCRHIAQGGLSAFGSETIGLDLVAFDSIEDSLDVRCTPATGPLSDVLVLEKTALFDLADQLGWPIDGSLKKRLAKPPTQSFPAFLEFGIGLDHEDAGRLDRAIESYQRAIELDPSFDLARGRADDLGARGTDLQPLDSAIGASLLKTDLSSDRALRSAIEVGPKFRTEAWDPRLGPASKTGFVDFTVTGTLP